MKSIVRNVVNHEEIMIYLKQFRSYSSDPLYQEFIDKNLKNFLVKDALIKEVEDFQASFPGPYHAVVLNYDLTQKISNLCKTVAIDINTKIIDSSLSVTKIQVNKMITQDLEFRGTTDSYFVYKINTPEKLKNVGEKLHNCLSKSHFSEKKEFFLFLDKESLKEKIVVYTENNFLIEARTNQDALPTEAESLELNSFFSTFIKGRLKSSSTILSYSVLLNSLLILIDVLLSKYEIFLVELGFLYVFSIIGTVAFVFFSNIHSQTIHRFLYNSMFRKLFYEIN